MQQLLCPIQNEVVALDEDLETHETIQNKQQSQALRWYRVGGNQCQGLPQH